MEDDFFFGQRMNCYNFLYPYRVLSGHQFEQIDFEPITILYGGNGSGKSTALNIIAEKLKLQRDTLYNRSSFYETYVDSCEFEVCKRYLWGVGLLLVMMFLTLCLIYEESMQE